MADKTLSELAAASPLASDDLVLVEQGGNSRKATAKRFKDINGGGWAFYNDSATALEANAVTILAGVRTLFTVNGGTGSQTGFIDTNAAMWSSNRHVSEFVGESFTWRLQFKAKKTGSSADQYILVEQDVGGAVGTVTARELAMRKAQGATHDMSISWAGYALDTYLANGAYFYLTPSADVQVWAKGIFIRRDYVPG